jgi:hypothetical protein
MSSVLFPPHGEGEQTNKQDPGDGEHIGHVDSIPALVKAAPPTT